MNGNDTKTRIVNFINNNPDKKQYILSAKLESGIVIMKNGVEASINDLENGTFNWGQFTEQSAPVTQGVPVQSQVNEPVAQAPVTPLSPDMANQMPQPTIAQPEQPIMQAPVTQAQNTSLQDVKTLFETSVQNPNNKVTLDNILKNFASNEQGMIDIGKAISVVTENSENIVVDAIMSNKGLPTELYKFAPDGKIINPSETLPFTDVDTEINKVFNNVLIYANGVSAYGMQSYGPDVITSAKNSFVASVNKKLTERGYNSAPTEPIVPTNTVPTEPSAPVVPVQENVNEEVTDEKAGFADIFILVLIVAVYAVIIVNLIMKIK